MRSFYRFVRTTRNGHWRRNIAGKKAVRQDMTSAYLEPPKFMVKNLIGEAEFIIALGEISLTGQHGGFDQHSYCDVRRFCNEKMYELNAFVV